MEPQLLEMDMLDDQGNVLQTITVEMFDRVDAAREAKKTGNQHKVPYTLHEYSREEDGDTVQLSGTVCAGDLVACSEVSSEWVAEKGWHICDVMGYVYLPDGLPDEFKFEPNFL